MRIVFFFFFKKEIYRTEKEKGCFKLLTVYFKRNGERKKRNC